jgi:hypothetical protein
MKKCNLQPTDFKPIIQALIINDSKYFDYENVVKFFLESKRIDDRQKSLAIANVNTFYGEARFVSAGTDKMSKVKNLDLVGEINTLTVSHRNDIASFLSAVRKRLDVAEPKPVLNSIAEKWQALMDKGNASVPLEFYVFFIMAAQHARTQNKGAKSVESILRLINELENEYLPAIYKSHPRGAEIKKKFEQFKKERSEEITSNPTFKSVTELSTVTETFLVTLTNESVVEGLYNKELDQFTDLNGDAIPKDNVKGSRAAHVKSNSFEATANYDGTQAGDDVLRKDDVSTGIRIDNSNNNKKDLEAKLLEEGLDNLLKSKRFRIKAVSDNAYMESRMARIRKEKGFEGRSVETFESDEQVRLLQSGERSEVIAFYRGPGTFAVYVEDTQTGESVNIFGPSNKAIVTSTNEVIPIDWNNSSHVEIFKRNARLNVGGRNTKELTDNDIEQILRANQAFQRLQSDLISVAQGGKTADITEIFYKYYGFKKVNISRNSPSNKSQLINFESFLERFPHFTQPIKYFIQNTIETSQEMNLGIIFKRNEEKYWGDREILEDMSDDDIFDEMPLIPTSNLPENAVIIGEDGEYLTLSEYIATKTDAASYAKWVRTIIANKTAGGLNLATFLPDRRIDHRVVHSTGSAKNMSTFFSLISEIAKFKKDFAGMSNDERIQRNKELFVERFAFMPKNGLGATFQISTKGQLTIRINPTGTVLESDGDSNFYGPVSNDVSFALMTDVLSGTFGASERSNFESLKQYKEFAKFPDKILSTSEGVSEYFTVMEKFIIDNQSDPFVLQLSHDLRIGMNNFVQVSVKNAIDNAFKAMAEGNPKLYASFMGNSTSESRRNLVGFEYQKLNDPGLVKREQASDGAFSATPVPRYSLRLADKTVDRGNLNNYQVYSPTTDEFIVIPTLKNPSSTSTAQAGNNAKEQPKPAENKKESEKIPESRPIQDDTSVQLTSEPDPKENSSEGHLDGMSNNEDLGFSLAPRSSGASQTRTQEEAKAEEDWLTEALPQFGLKIDDIRSLFDGVSEEMDIQGAFAKNMIYLDRALAKKGTLYHEAFHAVFRNYVSGEERYEAIDSILYSEKYADNFTPDAVKKFTKDRSLHDKAIYEIKDLIAEEVLADKFQQYMLDKKTDSSFFEKIFKLLEKLLRFVKGKKEELVLFGRIESGYYKNYNANPSSAYNKGEAAFQLISARVEKRNEEDDNGQSKVRTSMVMLSPSLQKKIVFQIANEVLALSNSNMSVIQDKKEELFKEARTNISRNNYQIEKYLENLPAEAQAEVRRTFQMDFDNARSVLGWDNGTDKGVTTINTTSDPKQTILVEYESLDAKSKDVMTEYRKEGNSILERQVMEVLIRMTVNDKVSDEASESAKEAEEKNESSDKSSDLDRDEQSDGSGFDSNFLNLDLLESIPNELRRFFGTIQYNKTHTLKSKDANGKPYELKIPTTVDAAYMYGVLMKTAAGTPAVGIFKKFESALKRHEYNGLTELAEGFKAILGRLSEEFTVDKNGVPSGNKRLYHQIISAMSVTQMDASKLDIVRKTDYVNSTPEDLIQTVNIYKNEALLKADINKRRDHLINEIRNQNSEAFHDEKVKAEYIKNVEKLIRKLNTASQTNQSMMTKIATDDVSRMHLLESTTSEYKLIFDSLGIVVPKSLIRLSILGNEVTKFKKIYPADGKFAELLKENKKFIQDKNYFDLESLLSLAKALKENIDTGKSSLKNLSVLVDPLSNKRDAGSKAIAFMLKTVSAYIVHEDPSMNSMTAYNSDNKKIFRFTKYTPTTIMLQEIRDKGLERYISEMDFGDLAQEYMNDNPFVKSAINGMHSALPEKSAMTIREKEFEMFFRDLNIAVNAGFTETQDGAIVRSASFKNYTDSESLTTGILNFLNRTTRSEKVKMINPVTKKEVLQDIEVSTFGRIFGTLEASNTSFAIDSMILNLTKEESGKKVQDTAKVKNMLVKMFVQDFKRIAREKKNIEDRIHRYNTTEATAEELSLLDGYNVALDPETKEADTNNSLRAFNFITLQDLFQTSSISGKENKGDDKENPGASEIRDLFVKLATERTMDYHASNNIQYEVSYDNIIQKLDLNISTGLNLGEIDLVNRLESLFVSGTEQPGYISRKQAEFNKMLIAEGLLKNALVSGEATELTLVLNKSIIPNRINKGGLEKPGNAFAGTNAEYKSEMDMLMDYFWNDYFNRNFVNQVFENDRALGVKNVVELVKRYKRMLAAGNNQKSGHITVATIDNLFVLINEKYIEDGQFDTLAENENLRPEDLKKLKQDVADGQAFISVNHRMRLFEEAGRLSEEVKDIMIASQVRPLTRKEIKVLKENKSMLNSLKTVHATAESYFKYSEMNIARSEVSIINFSHPDFGRGASKLTEGEVHNLIIGIYKKVDKLYQDLYADQANGSAQESNIKYEISKLTKKAHQYFRPDPTRVELHNLLNSMEYHAIDSAMDQNASKAASVLPISIQKPDGSGFNEYENGYYPLNKASKRVSAQYKMLQVETSGTSESVKNSVQAKVLITADIRELISHLQGNESNLKSAYLATSLGLLEEDYNKTLTEGTRARLRELYTVNREDGTMDNPGDLVLTNLYLKIQDALINQKADADLVNMFNLDSTGKIKNDPNIPEVRAELEKHLVAHYNKLFFDEKITGQKAYHVSSFGMKVMEDTLTGKIVPTYVYRADGFIMSDRYKVRHMGVQKTHKLLPTDTTLSATTVVNPKIDGFPAELQSIKDRILTLKELADVQQEIDSRTEDIENEDFIDELYILKNLPPLTSESAYKGVRLTVGNKNGDIKTHWINNSKGVTISTAAHNIKENAPEGVLNNVETTDIEDIIHGIIQRASRKEVMEELDPSTQVAMLKSEKKAIVKKLGGKRKAEFTPKDLDYIQAYSTGEKALDNKILDDNMITEYVVEIMLPDPGFKSQGERDFFLAKANEMFGTRIPTEDKRSMIAFKVVDFIDGSYENTVVAPMIIHLLSGSDLDIDSLYIQSKAYFKDLQGNFRLFGDYANESNLLEDEMRYLENFTEMLKDKNYKKAISSETSALFENDMLVEKVENPEKPGEYRNVYETETIINIIEQLDVLKPMLELSGFDENFMDTVRAVLQRDELFVEQRELYTEASELQLSENVEDHEAAGELFAVLKNIKQLMTAPLSAEIEERTDDVKALRKQIGNFSRLSLRLIGAYNGLVSEGAFIAYEDFARMPAELKLNKKALQNKNLQAKIDILKNEAVFNSAYKDERATAKDMSDVAEDLFGLDPKDVVRYLNANSITAQVTMSGLNNSSKDGVGIAANFNKFLAVATSLDLRLSSNKRVWHYTDKNGHDKVATGFLHGIDKRAVSLIGNILGMFTDAAKEPIPGMLGIDNEANSLILFLISLGMDTGLAIRLSMVTGFKSASNIVKKADMKGERRYMSSELIKQADKLLKGNKAAAAEFKQFVTKTGFLTSGKLNKASAVNISYKSLGGEKLDLDQRRTGASTDQLKLTVTNENGETFKNSEVAEVALLYLLSEQSGQSSDLLNIGNIINLFKSISSQTERIERFAESENIILTKNLFENQVELLDDSLPYATMIEAIQDLQKQMGNLFLEMRPELKGLTYNYKSTFSEHAVFAKEFTTILTADRIRKRMLDGYNKGKTAATRKKAGMFLAMTSPEYWYGLRSENFGVVLPSILEDYDTLQVVLPNNAFVKTLAQAQTFEPLVKNEFNYLKMPNMQFTSERLGDLSDGYSEIINHSAPEISDIGRRLFYHEVLRNGLGSQPSSFMRHVTPQLRQQLLGASVNQLIESLEEGGVDKMIDFLGYSDDSSAFYDKVHDRMVKKSAGLENNRIARTPKDLRKLSNLSSERFGVTSTDDLKGDSFKMDFASYMGMSGEERSLFASIIKAEYNSKTSKFQVAPVVRRQNQGADGKYVSSYSHYMLTDIDGNTPGETMNIQGSLSGESFTYTRFVPKKASELNDSFFTDESLGSFENYKININAIDNNNIVRESSIALELRTSLAKSAFNSKEATEDCSG